MGARAVGSDHNAARALFLSNTAEERVEALDIIPDSLRILQQRSWLRDAPQPLTSRCDPRLR